MADDRRRGSSDGRSSGRRDQRTSTPRSDSGRGGTDRSRGAPRTDGKPSYSPRRSSAPADGPSAGRRSDDRRAPRLSDARAGSDRTEDQARYDGPPLDEAITGKELDTAVLAALSSLPERLAARVARHLVAAGRLMDEDPETAYDHTRAARARASRVAIVREACGEAAYAAGKFAEALSELRAARRMSGDTTHLAVMADCERALGRPERALALARHPAVARLPDDIRMEMTIVEAGARRDLGELDGAIRLLEAAPLRSASRAPWVARLRYAYADALLADGRHTDAAEWFHRTLAVDLEGATDAEERLEEMEGRSP